MKYCLFAILMIAAPVYATGLDDLKAALTPLQGLGSLRGAYEVRETRNNLAASPAKGPETLQASAVLSEDASALEVRWERSLLKRAADEASPARGANRKEGLALLIATTTAPRLANAINYAPRLLQSLAMARLKSERNETCHGKPCRVIELLIEPEEVPNDNIKVKENTIVAHYWLGPDNLPIAAVTNHVVNARFMVVMSYEKSTREELAFSVVANRLVVLRRSSQGKEKWPGTDNEFNSLYTLTPRP